MTTKKILETRVVVAVAQVLLGANAPTERRPAFQALVTAGKLEAVLPLVDLASGIDDLAAQQERDAKQLAGACEAYAQRLAENPTACVSNPMTSSVVVAISERAARLEEKASALALVARVALGAEVAQAVARAMRGN